MSPNQQGRRQVAALPIRRTDTGIAEVLLVTSRETKRWIVPKGWPMSRKADCDAAAIEAREEAGAVGRVSRNPIGAYTYFKRRERHFDLVEVAVFQLDVAQQLKEWPEQAQRLARWFTPTEAAELVQEPGLSAIILRLLEPASDAGR